MQLCGTGVRAKFVVRIQELGLGEVLSGLPQPLATRSLEVKNRGFGWFADRVLRT